MLTSTRIQLSSKVPLEDYENITSALQGAMMEFISDEYAEFLHTSQMHPYSQSVYIEKDSNTIQWTINTLNDDAKKNISDKIKEAREIRLNYKDLLLEVVKVTEESISYEYLVKEYFFGECDRKIRIRFDTPCSFKHDGSYMIFPNVRWILQSLMKRYDISAENSTEVFSEDVLESIDNKAEIIGYRLQSTKFNIGSAKIPSFKGEITIFISGPQQMVNLVWLLMKFGEFSGVGIKTAMGMGSIQVMENNYGKK